MRRTVGAHRTTTQRDSTMDEIDTPEYALRRYENARAMYNRGTLTKHGLDARTRQLIAALMEAYNQGGRCSFERRAAHYRSLPSSNDE